MRRTDDLNRLSNPGLISQMHSRATWIEVQEAIDDDQKMPRSKVDGTAIHCQLRRAFNSHEVPLPMEGPFVPHARVLDTAQPYLHLEDPVINTRATTKPRFAGAIADMNNRTAEVVNGMSGGMHANGAIQGPSFMPARRTPTIPFRTPFLHLADIPAPGGPTVVPQ